MPLVLSLGVDLAVTDPRRSKGWVVVCVGNVDAAASVLRSVVVDLAIVAPAHAANIASLTRAARVPMIIAAGRDVGPEPRAFAC